MNLLDYPDVNLDLRSKLAIGKGTRSPIRLAGITSFPSSASSTAVPSSKLKLETCDSAVSKSQQGTSHREFFVGYPL